MYTLHYIYTYIDNQYCFALFCRRWGSTGQLTRNREEEPVRNWIMSMMTSDDWGCCISNMMIVTTVTNHWSVTGFNVIPSLKRRKPFDTLQTQHNFTRHTSPAAHTIQIYTDSCQRFNTGVHAFTRTVVHWVTDWQQWCIVWHCDRHPANLAFCYHFNGRACTCTCIIWHWTQHHLVNPSLVSHPLSADSLVNLRYPLTLVWTTHLVHTEDLTRHNIFAGKCYLMLIMSPPPVGPGEACWFTAVRVRVVNTFII